MININDFNILEESLKLGPELLVTLGCVLLLALLCGWLCVLNLLRRRVTGTLLQGFFMLLILTIVSVALLLGINMHTYARFTLEREIAQIHFQQTSEQSFIAFLHRTDNSPEQRFLLYGDQWQMDARVLKWKDVATLFGLDSTFRFERLTGRYADVDAELSAQRSVYELSSDKGLSIVELLARYPDYFSFVDTYFGSSVYMPMVDTGKYEIIITQNGLLARPVNEVARQAVNAWR